MAAPGAGSPDDVGATTVRDATAADAAAICRIYNQGIQDRLATLETEERTPEERRAWLRAVSRPTW
jgi:L-amino acid N-acyltransferase YncA